MILKVKKLHADAKLPIRAYINGDLGYDIYSNVTVDIYVNQVVRIDTGIALGFPEGWGGIIKDRSSLASKGLMVSGGVIDNGYSGAISVLMTYVRHCPFTEIERDGKSYLESVFYRIEKGDKIAQLIPTQVINWDIEKVDELELTDRGNNGFGSSGNL